MKKIYKILLLFTIILVVSGCSNQTVDASSEESLKDSLSDIRQSLSSEKSKEFDEALRIVMFQDFNIKNIMMGNLNENFALSSAKKYIDGKTADEIILESKNVKEKRLQEKRNKLLEEISELEDKEIKSKDFENKIIISNEKIYEEKERFSNKRVIEFNLTNNTEYTISRVEIIAKFLSDDREVPWSEITISDYVPGGILSNESKNIKIDFSFYSYKGMKLDEIPDEAYLKVVIKEIYDEENIKVYPIKGFNEYDKQRLKNLIQEYQRL